MEKFLICLRNNHDGSRIIMGYIEATSAESAAQQLSLVQSEKHAGIYELPPKFATSPVFGATIEALPNITTQEALVTTAWKALYGT